MEAQFVDLVRRRRSTQSKRHKRRQVRPQRFPRIVEQGYTALLLRLVEVVHAAINRRLLPMLPRLAAEAQALVAHRQDAPDDVFKGIRLIEGDVGETFKTENLKRLVEPVGRRTSEAQKVELGKQLQQAVRVELPLHDPAFAKRLNAFTTENINLIQSIPAEYLGQVQKVVFSGLTSGKRWEDIAEQLEERHGVAESRAALIARDQCGKFFSAVNEARQTQLGITSYVWCSSLDERVRPEHAALEGKTFKWSNPPSVGHPGEDFLCRCTSAPDLDELLDQLEE